MSTEPEEEVPKEKQEQADEDEEHAVGNEEERAGFAKEVKRREEIKRTSDPAIPVVKPDTVGEKYDPAAQQEKANNFDLKTAESSQNRDESKRVTRRPLGHFERRIAKPWES